MTRWVASGAPLQVDESADNPEPTEADIEEARQNYLHMSATLRAYIDALARRFDGTEDDRNIN